LIQRQEKIFYDKELKAELAAEYPYGQWIQQNMVKLEKIETVIRKTTDMGDQYNTYITSFNYSLEDTTDHQGNGSHGKRAYRFDGQ